MSTDEPTSIPILGAQHTCVRPSTDNLADALTDVADKIAASQTCNPSGNYSSSKSSGKYI